MYMLVIGLLGLIQGGYGQITPNKSLAKDSVVVTFGNKTRMIIVSEEKGGVQHLQKYDFNEILKDVGIFTENAKDKETYLYINETTGKRYLKDTTLVMKEKTEPRTETKAEQDSTLTSKKEDSNNDNNHQKDHHHWHHNRTEFAIDLGFNTYMENGKIPSRYNSDYGLSPLRSRYIALSIMHSQRIGGRKSPFYVRTGIEVAWNNLMLEGNNYVKQTPSGITFPEYVNNTSTTVSVEKSKLVVPYLSIPVVPTLQFRNKHGRQIFRIGAGGYAGVRLGSHTKLKYEDNGTKGEVKEYGSFYLNDFRYGLMAQIGVNGLCIFAKYDLNPLFNTERGPDFHVLSFGLSFFTF